MARNLFPADLVLAQTRVIHAYTALARHPRGSSTPLRRTLVCELRNLHAHPYWSMPGSSYADLVELRCRARE
ncbi:hypothetical protein [Streptomyces sp. NBC_01233]|uniref:hypothetical protein n=1 Tax=Streptomyces sp. NBC_01233 TaxID=2903787 RepID=UPI002E10E9A8|nr:hypothetical protein OG332_41560 [Streptomyces sp. NBC_01233]